MTRVTLIDAWLAFAGAGLCLLGVATPLAAPQGEPDAGPEAQRIRLELNHLREDSGARRAFYDELRRTLERVRAGQPDDDSQNSSPPGQATPKFPGASGAPPKTPATHKPDPIPPRNPKAVRAFLSMDSGQFVREGVVPAGDAHAQASLVTGHGQLDRAAYLRVVRNAKSNGAPVPLALGVAWIESRLETHPPRGAAGEVGMFQILPERCRIEGWPPKRLKEPEFNAWLGSMLLARYYREENSWARAAAKYVAGPGVFDRSYSEDLKAYINWYASSVESYAGYFSRYLS